MSPIQLLYVASWLSNVDKEKTLMWLIVNTFNSEDHLTWTALYKSHIKKLTLNLKKKKRSEHRWRFLSGNAEHYSIWRKIYILPPIHKKINLTILIISDGHSDNIVDADHGPTPVISLWCA